MPTAVTYQVDVEHQTKMEDVFRFWDRLADFGYDQTEAAMHHCMRELSQLLGARDAFWVGAVRVLKDPDCKSDIQNGWRIRGIQYLGQPYFDMVSVRESMQLDLPDDPGATNIALAAGAGVHRAYRLSEGILVDLPSFRCTAHYDIYYTQPGVVDRLWVVFPVNAEAESYFCFDRFLDQPEFTDDELALASYALRGIKWFHRQLMLHHGMGIGMEPLTTSEHRVKQCLLSGASEKEIATKLGLSAGTVHQYAIRIYRKFGVKGRAEFMSLWLSGSQADTTNQ